MPERTPTQRHEQWQRQRQRHRERGWRRGQSRLTQRRRRPETGVDVGAAGTAVAAGVLAEEAVGSGPSPPPQANSAVMVRTTKDKRKMLV